MLTFLLFNFFVYSNPHCEIRCLEEANSKLVSSCIKALDNYVNRYYMTREQAIEKLQSSAVMNSRCTFKNSKIYAKREN